MKKKNLMSKVLVLALALVMVFTMTASAFAASQGKVSVSITTGNFNSNGVYVGGGSALTTISKPLTNREISLSDLSDWVDYGIKETYYLPEDVDDPLDGDASVLDAVLAVLFEEGYDDIEADWSSYSDPANGYFPGGYIHNFGGVNVNNTVTYFNNNGMKYGRSVGWGWNIAFKPANESNFRTAAADGYDHYMSDIAVSSGMDIIIDLSQYSIEWNTGEPWTAE